MFDLDGTLADVRHRLHHLRRRPKDWPAFFAAVGDDPLLETGAALVRESARDCDVIYLTGRPAHCRGDTLRWLRAHDLPPGRLAMRRSGDRRPARAVKVELLRPLAAGRVVAVVVDDDEQACAAYRAQGWPVLHACWATQTPLLVQAQLGEGRT